MTEPNAESVPIFFCGRVWQFRPPAGLSRIALCSFALLVILFMPAHGIGAPPPGDDARQLLLDAGLSSPQMKQAGDEYTIDWHEINLGAFDPVQAPIDAALLNREPPAGKRYTTLILSVGTIMLLRFATIVALIWQERRRRRMAVQLEVERLELVHLERATKLGELSGAFAHELGQPLTSILANAEVARLLLEAERFDVQEMRDIINDIIVDNRRAVKIISQLRRLLVKGEITNEMFNLNDAVLATVEMTRRELSNRKTEVDLRLYADPLPVRGNYPQIQQIVLNLLFNAADAMSQVDHEQRSIAIQTRKCGNRLREIVISDRGPGIPSELRPQIFKPFVSTKQNGLGLGLAICQTIAQAHGGRLRIQDDPSPGATIVLELPAP
jgi:signal transduction histidine kinase